ncbi:serine protease [Scytonema sp. NUACC26]|uniref:S1 family peptidase n=1 Tax=Scytonema sp. NUACC26 TaxID=3140176 RepID=UPI0034DC464E
MTIYKRLLLGAMTALIFITLTSENSKLNALNNSQKDTLAQQTMTQNQVDEAPNLTASEVEAIAAQTTVVIAIGLQKGDIEKQIQLQESGSGAIVAKRGKTYYVVTNLHVVHRRGGIYGVYTYDGEVHPVDDQNKNSNIYVFGKEQGEGQNVTINGFDLAIIQFDSDKNYPLAPINLSKVTQGNPAYVSGWPVPQNKSPRRERRFSSGKVIEVKASPSSDGGYSLSYSSVTQPGMSGGPVFNAKGKVFGIHGRGTDVEYLGILVDHLMTQAENARKNGLFPRDLTFNFAPTSPQIIKAGIPENRPKSADVINNFYKSFNIEFKRSGTRDCPSGGSRTVLLGGKDERCD